MTTAFSRCLLSAFITLQQLCHLHGAPATNPPRVVQSLDDGWRFHRGALPEARNPGYDDKGWRSVDVPHDYVIEGTFVENDPTANKGGKADWFWLHGFLPVQPAVCRKELSIPESAKGKTLWLEFDGVFNNSRYWLNGKEVYSQHTGYTRARFDFTDAANFGDRNTLVVELAFQSRSAPRLAGGNPTLSANVLATLGLRLCTRAPKLISPIACSR